MKNITEKLETLLEDTNNDLEWATITCELDLIPILKARVAEIRNLLAVTTSWDSHPPESHEMDDYAEQAKELAERTRALAKDRLSAGKHGDILNLKV